MAKILGIYSEGRLLCPDCFKEIVPVRKFNNVLTADKVEKSKEVYFCNEC